MKAQGMHCKLMGNIHDFFSQLLKRSSRIGPMGADAKDVRVTHEIDYEYESEF
jgi:hypothetical protein